MSKQENIAKRGPVIWANYELKLKQLDILFHFITHAFHHLSETKRKEFVRGLKLEEETSIAKRTEKMRRLSKDFGELKDIFDEKYLQEFAERQQKKVKAAYRGRTHTQYAEWVNDGMISAEILFRVTVFEDFLKHVHANMLRGNPAILGLANKNRMASYADVFFAPFEQFKEKGICREVKEVDRESMKYRLDYFAKHLGIDFKKERQWLIEISDIRNKIAHGKPLEAITKDDTTIPLPDIQNAVGRTIHDAMHAAFNMGKSKHPTYFLLK